MRSRDGRTMAVRRAGIGRARREVGTKSKLDLLDALKIIWDDAEELIETLPEGDSLAFDFRFKYSLKLFKKLDMLFRGGTKSLQFDHITPYSKGAPATVDNLQLLCANCNAEKRAKTPHCPKCNNWIAADAVYCHSCGASIPRRVLNSNAHGQSRGLSTGQIVGLVLIFIAIASMMGWCK